MKKREESVRLSQHRPASNRIDARKLGEALSELIEKEIAPRQVRYAAAMELWCQLLPDELRRHCRVADISRGQMKVEVDAPSYMYELQLCSAELVEQLRRRCPQSRIKGIKFVPA